MAELIAKSPCAGLLPVVIGAVHLTEVDPGPMAMLAPFKGQGDAAGKALKKAHGLDWPGPGQTSTGDAVRALWFGRAHILLIGAAPAAALAKHAAVTDQSDAWACVQLDGPGATQVLARLTPLDLRADAFGVGATARTEVQHMAAAITRLDADRFQIMVFRSMAATLVHDLKTAMDSVAARAGS